MPFKKKTYSMPRKQREKYWKNNKKKRKKEEGPQYVWHNFIT